MDSFPQGAYIGVMMAGWDFLDYSRLAPRKKVWRYPGVPIPFRLQHKYEDRAQLESRSSHGSGLQDKSRQAGVKPAQD